MKLICLFFVVFSLSSNAFSPNSPKTQITEKLSHIKNINSYTYEDLKKADTYFYNLEGIEPGSDYEAVFKFNGACVQIFQKLINFLTPYYDNAYDGYVGWASQCYPISKGKSYMRTAMYIYSVGEEKKKKLAESYKKLNPEEGEAPKFLERFIPLRKATSTEITYTITINEEDKTKALETSMRLHNIPMASYWLSKFKAVNESPNQKEDLYNLTLILFSKKTAKEVTANGRKIDQINIWARFLIKNENWYSSVLYPSNYPFAMVSIKPK